MYRRGFYENNTMYQCGTMLIGYKSFGSASDPGSSPGHLS
jgi:hypothetical protein